MMANVSSVNNVSSQSVSALAKAEGRPVVVLVHGFPNTSELWAYQIASLRDHAEVVLLDLGSESVLVRITDRLAQIVRCLAADNPQRRIVLVGHDLGCFAVNEVALQCPDAISHQILLNGAGIEQFASRRRSVTQWLRSSYVLLLQLPLVPSLVHGFARLVLRGPSWNFAPIMLYRNLMRRAVQHVRAGKSDPVCRVPTVLVDSDQDLFLDRTSADELARFYASARLYKVPGGHWSPLSAKSHVNKIIANTLSYNEAQHDD